MTGTTHGLGSVIIVSMFELPVPVAGNPSMVTFAVVTAPALSTDRQLTIARKCASSFLPWVQVAPTDRYRRPSRAR